MRATKGGQYGKNGEWYDGGQFLPGSENTIKGEFNRAKVQPQNAPRKQEVAPYKYEISDRPAIWPKVQIAARFHKTGYSKETGAQGWLEFNEDFNWQAMGWTQEAVKETKELINRWNNGERYQ